jgi:small subunit ribosomal protein S4
MIRKKKKFARPKKPFDKVRIESEDEIIKKYGLKNKKEIWKTEFDIKKMREKAKGVLTSEPEKQQRLIESLNKKGLNVKSVADILGLDKESLLKRRLQTVLSEKMNIKPKQARQFITHKHVYIDKKRVNSPGYIVNKGEEGKIELILKPKKIKEDNKDSSGEEKNG